MSGLIIAHSHGLAKPLVLDTPIILNLMAVGVGQSILTSLNRLCFVCTAVANEAIYVRAEEPGQPPQRFSIDSWLEAGTISLVSPEGPAEEELYVRFAAELDDGESMSLAICHARGFALGTDDRKARRLAAKLGPTPVDLVSTAEILCSWAQVAGVANDSLRRVILAVELRARFRPPPSDSCYEWWMRAR